MCVCVWGGGGCWGGCPILSMFFRLLEKEKLGHFLTHKESACQIAVDSELQKSQRNRYTPPFHGVLQLQWTESDKQAGS